MIQSLCSVTAPAVTVTVTAVAVNVNVVIVILLVVVEVLVMNLIPLTKGHSSRKVNPSAAQYTLRLNP